LLIIAFIPFRQRGSRLFSLTQPVLGRRYLLKAMPRNNRFIGVSLAVLLVASLEADELVSPDNGGCAPDTKPGRPAAERVYAGRKITLDFKDADIVNVLRMLSEIGGENIVITDDVRGRITVRLVDVPWDQAFDVVLQANHLACVRLGNVRGVLKTGIGRQWSGTSIASSALVQKFEMPPTYEEQ
jgi:type II secretory pathway component GspD/PulD (secretin)